MISYMIPKAPLAPRLAKSVLSEGSKIEFKPGVNLLVGPNGCGKSSILESMRPSFNGPNRRYADYEVIRPEGKDVAATYFSFEKDNPRTGSFDVAQEKGVNSFLMHFNSKHRSHGEVTRTLIEDLVRRSGPDQVFILDEPELALDFDNLMLLRSKLDTLNNQVIIATHSPFLVFHNYHVIELVPGYVTKMRASLQACLSNQ